MDFFESIAQSFTKTFITDDRWQQLLSGLGVTILITLVAAAIGVVLGFLIAMVRSTYDMQLAGKKCRSPRDVVLKILNAVCNVYITVIQTPITGVSAKSISTNPKIESFQHENYDYCYTQNQTYFRVYDDKNAIDICAYNTDGENSNAISDYSKIQKYLDAI